VLDDVGHGRDALERRAHAVAVVLTEEDDGSFHTDAMFSVSWNAPIFTAASPKKQTQTLSLPWYLLANARPAPRGCGRRRCHGRP